MVDFEQIDAFVESDGAPLYALALCASGDRETAVQIASDSIAEAYRLTGNARDAAGLSEESLRRLYLHVKKLPAGAAQCANAQKNKPLGDMLSGLNPGDRLLLLLHLWRGLSAGQIARILRQPAFLVRPRLKKTLSRMSAGCRR